MPQVPINIPPAIVPRVRAAWDGTFVRQEGETDIAFFTRILAGYAKKVVVTFEGQQAGRTAKATAESDAEAQIIIT